MAGDGSFAVTSSIEGPANEILYFVETLDPSRPWIKVRMRVLWRDDDEWIVLRITEVQITTGGLNAISPVEVLGASGWWDRMLDAVLDHLIEESAERRGVTVAEQKELGYGWEDLEITCGEPGPPDPADAEPADADGFEVLMDEIAQELRKKTWDQGPETETKGEDQ